MELTNINDILTNLQNDKANGRDHILALASALIEWMGFAYVENNKPRLLDFKTLKLKEALVPAPITGQEQIYRLTAENQNLRIRFAVLKKFDKKIIHYLVDNNVGLTSYQAGMRGIKQVEGREPYISRQPYFVHFITTAKYDRLWLVFNQGEQKRVLVFRKRLTQTQNFKILPAWLNIAAKPKPEMAKLFWSSLDVKEVNKEFYKHIKEQFDALIGIAKTQIKDFDEATVKQFAVRLIGRYIFCWFLKEKEIIPEALISSKTIDKFKEDYFQKYLTKLFFNTLNAEVTDPARNETITELDTLYKNIPYLNGGLFDFHPEDKLFKKIDLNVWLITFVKVLENFDFTVDESSSQYQQIAIDPEMLGRIFENLLASQNPDTEKMANQRKAFGAFYTPREIVDYMVNESLKAHLETQLLPVLPNQTNVVEEPQVAYKGSLFQHVEPQQTLMSFDKSQTADIERRREKLKIKINKLFLPDCNDNPFEKDETIKVRKALSEITVLDPACGSGAFPMGVMLRLMELRQIVGHGHHSSYDLKQEILSRNIFGVDIMPMAVEIARLRAWLSLVLEADYKPNDRKNNFGVDALPNLDFKFVCANSLIDSGYDEFLKKFDVQLKIHGSKLFELFTEIQKLEKMRYEYFDMHGDQLRKNVLKDEFSLLKSNIKQNFNSANLVLDEKTGKQKQVGKTTAESYGLSDFMNKIDDWNPFDDSHPSSFFSSAWMFGVRDGFDVVIGNPPYVEHKKLKDISSLLKGSYTTYSGTADLYVYFYENGIKCLKENGTLIFITSNKFIKTSYGENLRKYFAKYKINEIIDFTDVHVFDALVASCILSITKQNHSNGKLRITFANDSMINFSNLTQFVNQNSFSFPQNNLSGSIWQLENETNLSLKKKIENGSVGMESTETIKIFRGVTTGFNPAFIIGEERRNDLIKENKSSESIIKPLLQGRNIRKWIFNKTSDYLIFTRKGIEIDDFPAIKKHLYKFVTQLEPGVGRKAGSYNWFEIQDNTAYYSEFEKEKIIWGLTSDKWTFAYDNENNFLPSNGYILTSTEIPIKYLLALMNSRLMEYYFGFIGIMTAGGAYTLKQETVSEFPIKIIKNTKPFIERVEQILTAKSQNQPTTALEKEIDVMVYKLYELTYDEVKIIEPAFDLSEEEYSQYSIV